MLPLSFLAAHWRLIAFGFFMCLCSSFGQTFFISLFSGDIRSTFSLSHGEFGSIYSAGTLVSAAVLIWLGRLVDKVSLHVFSAAVLLGLAGTCFLFGSVWNAVALGVGVFGLRLFGQGLASHAGITAMGRYFERERGRTISLASLGYPAGEALLPIAVVAAFALVDWRLIWNAAGVAVLIAVPLMLLLLRGHGARDAAHKQRRHEQGADARDHALGDVLRDVGLWLRLPAILAPSFIFTGLIFHQVHLAASKGWPLALMAGSFTVFAVASVVTTILSGPLVDRVSARRLVPVFLLPLTLGCLVLALSDAPMSAPVFMVLVGINSGMTFVLMGALWPELYGVTHLGAIRAFGQSAMVFSTGLAPAVMGLAIDWGTSIETIGLACAVYCMAASALAALVPRPRRAAA